MNTGKSVKRLEDLAADRRVEASAHSIVATYASGMDLPPGQHRRARARVSGRLLHARARAHGRAAVRRGRGGAAGRGGAHLPARDRRWDDACAGTGAASPSWPTRSGTGSACCNSPGGGTTRSRTDPLAATPRNATIHMRGTSMRLIVLAAISLALLSCGGGSGATTGSATLTGSTIGG